MRHKKYKKYSLRLSHLRSIFINVLSRLISSGRVIVSKKLSLYLKPKLNKVIRSYTKGKYKSPYFSILESLSESQLTIIKKSTNCIQSLNLGTRLRDCCSMTLLVFIFHNKKN
ncbi:hypothetical protein JSR06_00775 [Candidatus Vidania fulgoroideae]|uniref:Uncharacterized protein n=1 Tax=Candidatus Vidania fulgoroideorum TaxID=881286 RepID=A0A974X7F5_9PROT|nr:hypothetical protein JSR06_00775 [Candidatus Vidania fulgoroideae]